MRAMIVSLIVILGIFAISCIVFLMIYYSRRRKFFPLFTGNKTRAYNFINKLFSDPNLPLTTYFTIANMLDGDQIITLTPGMLNTKFTPKQIQIILAYYLDWLYGNLTPDNSI